MKTAQAIFNNDSISDAGLAEIKAISPQIVFVFGAYKYFTSQLGQKLSDALRPAHVVGCTTAGEISDRGVSDNTITVTGVHFDKAKVRVAAVRNGGLGYTMTAGEALAKEIGTPDTKGVIVLGPGTNINGSSLIDGLKAKLKKGTVITGGLAGDGGAFKDTKVMLGSSVASDQIVGIGLSGQGFEVQFGSVGGWEPMGAVMKTTRAIGNLLFELDGKPALDVYASLLGPKAKDLPGSGLLFPFAIMDGPNGTPGTIRTLLGVNESNRSLVLAGDMPSNKQVTLMKAQTSQLVKGAEGAAKEATKAGKKPTSFSLLISCVGRKLVMGNDVGQEINAVKSILGNPHVTGFYSYGEICPSGFVDDCKLHNQTMTITSIQE